MLHRRPGVGAAGAAPSAGRRRRPAGLDRPAWRRRQCTTTPDPPPPPVRRLPSPVFGGEGTSLVPAARDRGELSCTSRARLLDACGVRAVRQRCASRPDEACALSVRGVRAVRPWRARCRRAVGARVTPVRPCTPEWTRHPRTTGCTVHFGVPQAASTGTRRRSTGAGDSADQQRARVSACGVLRRPRRRRPRRRLPRPRGRRARAAPTSPRCRPAPAATRRRARARR